MESTRPARPNSVVVTARALPRTGGRDDTSQLCRDVATLLTGIGTIVLAIATFALVFWARRYTHAQQAAVDEMQRGRIEAVQPALQLEATTLGPIYPMARLTSCGRGYALNIRGRLWRSARGAETWSYELRYPILAPGEHRDFLPNEQGARLETFVAEDRRFGVELTFEDAFGRRYRLTREVTWKDVSDHLYSAHMRRPQEVFRDIEQHLRRITEKIDRVIGFNSLNVSTGADRAEEQREDEARLEAKRRETEDTGSSDSGGSTGPPATEDHHAQLHVWMRAAEFDQRGTELEYHAVRRHIEDGRWIYEEQTICGRPIPGRLGLSLHLAHMDPSCEECQRGLGDAES